MSRRRRIARWLAVLGGLLLAGVAVDAAVLWLRIDRVDVDLPGGGDGAETWVLVGSDERGDLPPGVDPAAFGTGEEVPGRRADIVVVVQRGADGVARSVAINRDLVVRLPAGDEPAARQRVATLLLDGEQRLVDGLCRGFGIAADRVVVASFDAFVGLVDTVGGVEVTIDRPVRDLGSGLLLDEAGVHHLDGVEALAWLRSRRPEEFVGGAWVGGEPTAGERPARAATLLEALAGIDTGSPVLLHRLAWRVGPSVRFDAGFGLSSTRRLLAALRESDTVELPARYEVLDPVPVAVLETAATEVLAPLASPNCET